MKRAIVAVYRVRGALMFIAAGILMLNLLLSLTGLDENFSGEQWVTVRLVFAFGAMGLIVVSLLLVFAGPSALPKPETRTLQAPVQGRWRGMNSPATKVPSHGLRAYGQAYAIDLVFEPSDEARPAYGTGPAMRASDEYPAFGQPVLAMIDGVVVAASGWRRDHRARSNHFGLAYMMAEGAVRELGGPGFILGNHVTIRSDDGVFATVAHLQQGSVTVRVGDRVSTGQQIARCGNSGNSSEPHMHAQLMDRKSPWIAQGIAMAFAGISIEGSAESNAGLPANDEHMVAGSGSEITADTDR
ncbi:M23 family metallopeptidase [Humidisolicoccus flavus]|uniref:M23 family metallopeptidase n=1 Tax=Humidisolicoccus flavus TaxID=3111414 RepID=UPI003247811B